MMQKHATAGASARRRQGLGQHGALGDQYRRAEFAGRIGAPAPGRGAFHAACRISQNHSRYLHLHQLQISSLMLCRPGHVMRELVRLGLLHPYLSRLEADHLLKRNVNNVVVLRRSRHMHSDDSKPAQLNAAGGTVCLPVFPCIYLHICPSYTDHAELHRRDVSERRAAETRAHQPVAGERAVDQRARDTRLFTHRQA